MTTLRKNLATGALSVLGVIAFFYAFQGIGCIASAHATVVMTAGIPAPVVTPVTPGPDPSTVVVAWVGAILGGLSLLLTIAFQVLKVVAPLTKTRIDDEVRDGIGEILDHLRGQSSTTTVVVAQPAQPAPPRDPQSGLAHPLLLAVVAGTLIGGAAGFVVVGCAARQRGAAAVGAFIDCQAENLAGSVVELVPLAKQALMVAISGSGHVDFMQLKAAAAPIKSDLGRCVLAAAVAAIATPVPVQPEAPAAAPLEVDGPELRKAFVAVRGELGWPAVHLAGGTVL